MFKEIFIDQYLNSERKVPLIDVRSPKEYDHAHIPGATNMPLFDDSERATVGITYKNEGQEKAILKGLELVSHKIVSFVEQAKDIAENNSIVLHCWRGGMRSKSMATLFDFAGIKTEVIKGGYKSYRHNAKKVFAKAWNLIILGGKTGSAKTKILQALENQGEQIIDLEKLANHKGSAFGDLGEETQPTTEMFENLLFEELQKIDPAKRCWVEDESHLIGNIFIPEDFWTQMRNAPVMYCDFPVDERIKFLVETYGSFEKEGVVNAVKKITKRLGGENAKAALEAYAEGNLLEATRIVLRYYDKTYSYGLSQRRQERICKIEMQKIKPEENAKELVHQVKNITAKNTEKTAQGISL